MEARNAGLALRWGKLVQPNPDMPAAVPACAGMGGQALLLGEDRRWALRPAAPVEGDEGG